MKTSIYAIGTFPTAIKLALSRAYRDEPDPAIPLNRTANEVIGFEYVKTICVSRYARVE